MADSPPIPEQPAGLSGWLKSSIAGILILGALGSWLCSLTLQPGAAWVMDAGSKFWWSLRDVTYRNIAKGFHEKPASLTANSIATLMAMGLLLFATSCILKVFRSRKRAVATLEKFRTDSAERKMSAEERVKHLAKIYGAKNATPDDVAVAIEKHVEVEFKKLPNIFWPLYFLVPSTLALFAIMIVMANVELYENAAVSHFQQMLTITAPFLSEPERLTLCSRFAQIRTREDYVKVISELETVAKDKKQEVPEFQVW